MAKYGSGSVAFFLVDGFNLAGESSSLADATEAVLEETHGLTDAFVEQTPSGLRRAELAVEGFYDDATDKTNAALAGNQTSSRVVSYGVAGNTLAQSFVGLEGAFGGTYVRQATRGELTKASATWTVTGQKDEGVILLPLAAVTATDYGGAQDNSASSASGGVAYLHVTAASGTSPTLDVKVKDSADNATYADLITFTQATGVTAERKTVSGTVDQYLKIRYTIGGTDPSFTIAVGFARG